MSEIQTGELTCTGCRQTYPITKGVPRFVSSDNYASSFGYQWNLYKSTQLDNISGHSQSERRFFSETGWPRTGLQNEWILDVGCGSGRFMEVASRTGADVVGIDLSNAVDAAYELLNQRENVHFVQASVYELPFKPGVFDKAYCIGVIQHTPSPKDTIQAIPKVVKEGGQFAMTIYERRRFTLLYSKYLLRPVTKHIPNRLLLNMIKFSMPVLWPLTEILFRVPVLKKIFRFAIPICNYVDLPDLTWRQRYEWAILDTFDMLSPAYDQPQTESDVRSFLHAKGYNKVDRRSQESLNLVVEC